MSFLLKSGLPTSSEQITEEKKNNSNNNLQTSRQENTTDQKQQEQKAQKLQPVRVEQKAGRNEKVLITNGKETKELKWKKAKPLVDSGKWARVH